jgi:predicted small secreted protein
MLDRFQIIGASEISGLLKEYAGNLYKANIIHDGIYNKLCLMPKYLETRYSLAQKLKLDREQFKRFQESCDNFAMKRGRDCEQLVAQDYLNANQGVSIIDAHTSKDISVDNCKFKFRATIDYLLSNNKLLEVKTTSLDRLMLLEEIDFNYYIQTQAQMWLHNIDSTVLYYGGINSIYNKETKQYNHQLLSTKTFEIENDRSNMIVKAIKTCLEWFSYEYEKGNIFEKIEEEKTTKDLAIDNFIAIEKGTLRDAIDDDTIIDLKRLKELETFYYEYKELEEKIREKVKSKMNGYLMASFETSNYKIEAKYSKESVYNQECIDNAILKAKSLQIGDIKSLKKLTIKY